MRKFGYLVGLGMMLGLACASAQAQITCRQATAAEAKVFTLPSLMPGVISPHDGVCAVNFKVRAADGARLTANVFLPPGAAQGAKFPAVLFVTSWAMADFFEYVGAQHKLAKNGYVAMAYTPRGFWGSEGLVQVASPQDVDDASKALTHLLEQTPTDPARVGITGISYGAGISLLALASDSRIKTAVAMSGWGSLVDQLYANQVPNATWADLLISGGNRTGRVDPVVMQMAQRIKNPDSTQADIEAAKAWGALRSPAANSVVDAINARQAPVMISKNWRDEMFTPNSSMGFFERLTGPKRLMLQPGIHASAEVFGAVLGLPNEVYDEAYRWFDHWLKGVPNGINTAAKVKLQPRPGTAYETLSNWPASELKAATFYMGPRDRLHWSFACWCVRGVTGSLRETRSASFGTNTINNVQDTSATTGFIPIISAFADGIGLPVINHTDTIIGREHGVRYQSSKLTSTMRIRGIPRVNLSVSPQQPRGMLVAYLYSVDPLGFGTLITHGARAVHWATPNVSTDFSFDLNATAFDVPSGHRLELVFDTRDNLYGPPVHQGDVFKMKLETGGNSNASLVLTAR